MSSALPNPSLVSTIAYSFRRKRPHSGTRTPPKWVLASTPHGYTGRAVMVMRPWPATRPNVTSPMAHVRSCHTVKDAAPATPCATSVLLPWLGGNTGHALAHAHASFEIRRYPRPLRPCCTSTAGTPYRPFCAVRMFTWMMCEVGYCACLHVSARRTGRPTFVHNEYIVCTSPRLTREALGQREHTTYWGQRYSDVPIVGCLRAA